MSANLHNQNMDSCKSCDRYEAMSETEFPSLSTERKSSGKKNVIKLVVPLKTYKDELREKYESRPVMENRKTRMCDSIGKNEICRHGNHCDFAHSLEELVIRDCHYKDRCCFVNNKNGKLVNYGIKTCMNKHPMESRDEFIKRTGLSHYKTKHVEINIDLLVDLQEETNEKPTDFKPCESTSLGSVLVHQEPRPPTFGHPSLLENEIVLRVPKVLAMQALELAMNSGNRCIRVEVFD